jgi:methanogenic corrinoid protein MtbC1
MARSALLYLGDKLKSVYVDQKATAGSSELSAEAADTLLRAIEGEIIPRLMLTHSELDREAAAEHDRRCTLRREDHEGFLETVLRGTAASTRDFIDSILDRGVPREIVFIDLLGRCAKRLGEMWDEDLCDFSDVTIGLCRLHQALREHSVLHDPPAHTGVEPASVLLATACGDQHVFGVVMVAEFFRSSGWRVWTEPGASVGQVSSILATDRFDLLGISAACTSVASQLSSEIRHYRKASCNPEMRVLVGGRLFLEDADLVASVGADGLAVDAKAAPIAGKSLIADLPTAS